MVLDSKHLRRQAEHCRKLAKLLVDRDAVTELENFAREFDAEAERLEALQIERGGQVSASPAVAAMPRQPAEAEPERGQDGDTKNGDGNV